MFGKKGLRAEVMCLEIKEKPTAAAMLLFEECPISDVATLDESIQSHLGNEGLSCKSGEKSSWNGHPTSVHNVSGIPVSISLIDWPVPLNVFVENGHQHGVCQEWRTIAASHRHHLLVASLPIDHVDVRGGDAERLSVCPRSCLCLA